MDRQMDKDVVYLYNEILLKHKKEQNWVNVDEPRVCHTEWSKSEKYINLYIWNLEKQYWWTYLQGRNRGADMENWLVDTVREGEARTDWESGMDIYARPCKTDRHGELLISAPCDGLEGRPRRRDVYTQLIHAVVRETNNIVKQL